MPCASPGDRGFLSKQNLQGNVHPDPPGAESGATERRSGPRVSENSEFPKLQSTAPCHLSLPSARPAVGGSPLKAGLSQKGSWKVGPTPRESPKDQVEVGRPKFPREEESLQTRARVGQKVPRIPGLRSIAAPVGRHQREPNLPRSRSISTVPLGRPPPYTRSPIWADRGGRGPGMGTLGLMVQSREVSPHRTDRLLQRRRQTVWVSHSLGRSLAQPQTTSSGTTWPHATTLVSSV